LDTSYGLDYGTSTPPELQKIEFKPIPWQNAVRNVPTTDYGQTPATETGDGIWGMPIEQVRQRFEELKQTPAPTEVKPKAPVKRKLRIVNK